MLARLCAARSDLLAWLGLGFGSRSGLGTGLRRYLLRVVQGLSLPLIYHYYDDNDYYLLAGRRCCPRPRGRAASVVRWRRKRAAAPSGASGQGGRGAAARARPKRSCCVVSGAAGEIMSLRSSCEASQPG